MLCSKRIASLTLCFATVLVVFVDGERVRAQTTARRGDAAAVSFDEYCQDELPAERRERCMAGLDRVEASLCARDLEQAERAFGEAFEAAYRGGAESDLSIKRPGAPISRRGLRARLESDRQRAAASSSKGRYDPSDLRVRVAVGEAEDVIACAERKAPSDFVSCVRMLERSVDRLEGERRDGAYLLPEDEAIERRNRKALEDELGF